MKKVALSDSGYWIGLLDPKDPFNARSEEIATLISDCIIVLPWPCMYEIIATRLARRRDQLIQFEKYLDDLQISFLDDEKYKASALENTFTLNRLRGTTHSLTDSVIREILRDVNVSVDFVVTYNQKDFIDVCNLRGFTLLS